MTNQDDGQKATTRLYFKLQYFPIRSGSCPYKYQQKEAWKDISDWGLTQPFKNLKPSIHKIAIEQRDSRELWPSIVNRCIDRWWVLTELCLFYICVSQNQERSPHGVDEGLDNK